MATTPLIVITDAGDAVAAIATPQGPYIEISSFQVGSGYGYTPLKTDTGLTGNLLYTGKPASYSNAGDNTLNLVLRLPLDVGPFQFGEIAIFLADGTMFAKLAFETLQTKDGLNSGNNAVTGYTMNCLLSVGKSVGVFQVDTESGLAPPIWEVDKWSDIYPPNQSANPDIPTVIVRELTLNSNSSYVTKASDTKWTLATTYEKLVLGAITSATTTTVDIAKTIFDDLDIPPEFLLTSINRQFVLEFISGYFRSVSSVNDLGTSYRFNLNLDPLPIVPVAASGFVLFMDKFYAHKGFSPPINPADMQTISYTFATAGTFSLPVPALPNGWKSMQMRLSIQGAGAGGGGAFANRPSKNDWEGGGGGGGAGSSMLYDVPSPETGTITVVVGQRGLGGGGSTSSPFIGGNGGNGGASQVIVPGVGTYTASGGTRGTGANAGGGYGGSIGGGNGQSGSGRQTGSVYYGGAGGSTRYGSGGNTTGSAATGYGAGGGGGYAASLPDAMIATAGGAGKAGIIIIEFYDPNLEVLNSRYNPLITWLDSLGYGPVPANAR